ncbi:MAG: TolC family outer membrane protein, partial [Betaproteobacteria bacterium]
MNPRKILSVLLLAAYPLFGNAAEQPVSDKVVTPPPSDQFATLRDIAQKAVSTNPEVTVRWHNFRAAVEEVGVARGGYFPRVDLTAGLGRESLDEPWSTGYKEYSRNGYLLSLNQMVFDGFATRNEVKRLGKAQLVRYYELLEITETVALEAARAYLDVLRYRFLVDLAEDNYVQHRATFEQLLRRTQSGVGRRVDLEQAASRLALAEVNLTTETANLHDVTARYQRLVNGQPPKVTYAPALISRAFPSSQKTALEKLLTSNPTLLAASENIEVAEYDVAVRRAAYVPRLDLRARTDNVNNYQGLGDRANNVAELVVTYNLFNGGSDVARERQYLERRNMAVDMREKACRDTRQTLAIAYNDVTRLREQVSFLNIQVGLIEKTRDAYRDQFNVGQRTLLDLLDTENELLSARRSAINADMDLSVAYLRTYAGMGTLLEFLELKRPDVDPPEPSDALGKGQLCAAEPINVAPIDRDALNARALALLQANGTAFVPQAQPGAAAPAPVAPAAAAGPQADVTMQVRAWAALVARKDFAGYRSVYAADFTPPGGVTREQWFAARQLGFAQAGNPPADLPDLRVRMNGLDHATAEFTRDFNDDLQPGKTRKTLELARIGNNWFMTGETSVPAG